MRSRLPQAFRNLFFAFDEPGDPWRKAVGHVLQAALVLLGLIGFTSVFVDAIAPAVSDSFAGRLTIGTLLLSLYSAMYRLAIRQQRRAPAAWASVAMVTLELCLIALMFPYLYLLAVTVLPKASLHTMATITTDDGAAAAMFLGLLLFSVKGWMRYTHRAAHLRDASASSALFERMAMEDALTGLPNRRRFEARVNAHLQSAVPGVPPLCLLMIDVDRFKAINDTWSHDIGDDVLRAIAGRLAHVVGGAGLAARLAGDEFIVALFDGGEAAARAMARRAAQAVAEFDWHALQPGLGVSISVGVATFQEGDTLGDVMRRSDAAMYRAKRA